MAEKRCENCKHFLKEDCGDTVNVCNYILPEWINDLIDSMPVSRSSFYYYETDGSDCNAWQSKEVNVLDRVKEECERQIGFFDGQSYQGKLAQQILTILDQQENMK